MDQIKIIAIVLGVLNIILWLFLQPEEIKDKSYDIQAKILSLEKEIPELEKLASWTERAELCVKDPPSQEPNELISKLRVVAQKGGFIITESVNQGGEPSRIVVSGHGTYAAVAGVIAEIDHNKAAQIEKISMETRDDNLIETSIDAVVHNGPWCGQEPDNDNPEPVSEVSTAFILLGRYDLFSIPKDKPVQQKAKININYMGYYSENGRITVVLEEDGNLIILNKDEISSSGNRIVSATDERVVLANKKGIEWTIKMKKAK